MRKKRKLSGVFLLILVLWIILDNNIFELNTYTISSREIPRDFSGFRIAHVSDFHNTQFWPENQRLIALLDEANPDIIVITGDFADSRRTNISVAADFAAAAAAIAPCYYVTGNHEARLPSHVYSELEAALLQAEVTVLHNDSSILRRGTSHIVLSGLDDPSFGRHAGLPFPLPGTDLQSSELSPGDSYQILLSHRPELFGQYVQAGFDLVFSGHAHGGQFRLPLVGGLYAPNQGFLPKYDSGLYTEGSTNMLLSRGIGNSAFPFRFHNRPEIILAILDHISEP